METPRWNVTHNAMLTNDSQRMAVERLVSIIQKEEPECDQVASFFSRCVEAALHHQKELQITESELYAARIAPDIEVVLALLIEWGIAALGYYGVFNALANARRTKQSVEIIE